MSLFKQLHAVHAAQARMAAHRAELAVPASALLARGHKYPLLTLGAACGAGVVLGSMGSASLLRVPGLGALLRSGFADVVAQGVRLFAEMGADLAGDATE